LEAAKRKFYDLVRVQGLEANMISRAQEKSLLSQGVTHFNLSFQDAHGLFLSAVAEQNIALASDADHHIRTFLEQMAKNGKVSKKHFADAVAIYRRLTNGQVPDGEARRQVKTLMQENAWRARRSLVFPYPGSKRWFNKI